MSKLPWLTVFTEGTHSTKAAKKTYTAQDVDAIVNSTRALGSQDIPFTAGHPKNNLPVFGYFKASDVRRGTLNGLATVEVRPAEFADGLIDELAASKINKMSIRIVQNQIKHIGFVEKPAVKELPPLSDYTFSADDEGEQSDIDSVLEFSAELGTTMFEYSIADRLSSIGELFAGLRENMIAKDGNTDSADKYLPKEVVSSITGKLSSLASDLSWYVGASVREELKNAGNNNQPNYSQFEDETLESNKTKEQTPDATKGNAEFSAMQSRMEAVEAENKRLRGELEEAQFEAVAEKLLSEKKITPAEKPVVVSTLRGLKAASDFSADSKDAYKTYVDSLNARSPLSNITGSVATDGQSAEFAADEAEEKMYQEFNRSRGAR